VYLAARNEDRAKAAIEDLKETTGKEAIFLKLDLSSLGSIKAAAEEFLGWVPSDFQRAPSDSRFRQKGARTSHFIQQCVRFSPSLQGLSPTYIPIQWHHGGTD